MVPWRERGLSRRLRPEDLQVTDHRYGVTLALVRCRACGFIFADDEEIEELTLLYEQLSDPEYEASAEARRLQMRWLLRTVRRVHPGVRTLLDIGAATGLLVEEAQAQGLEAVGVEPGVRFVEAALRQRGIQLVHGVFPHPSLAGRRFDLVFLVDVIEHVAEPVDLLRHCAGALAPRGLVVVVTPDVASLAARLLGRRWWHYRLAHVGYFDRQSLTRAAAAVGLRHLRWFSARWFFPVHYLAKRAAEYLPVAGLNRLAARVPPLAWLYHQVIPLSLHDSFVVLLAGPAPGDAASAPGIPRPG
jgi:2-polyprenyl-3-methyl-5-hydroxy-6-metoxy-1,4-benzoquinol methylase